MASEMRTVLLSLHLGHLIQKFDAENLSPDIVGKLSFHEFQLLGVHSSADIMNVRLRCINYGTRGEHCESQFDISKQKLEVLLESGFKVSDISKLLSVSESTVFRRMARYGLKVHQFTDIDDDDLLRELKHIISEFPRCGEVMLKSILSGKGIKVPRSRLRYAIHSIDEEGIQERSRRRLHRRVYCVAAPNHCWHVDTNHKLIRWRLIIAGGIDGFSRLVVFLNCVNNNKAETLLDCFMKAVNKYGTPLRARSDQGMENLKIAEYMVHTRGSNGMITGTSTHNQRIERLWRDVYEGVLSYYYDLFYHMEDNGILDSFNAMNIFALHHVFLSKINKKLDIWCNAWARHRLRTARSSPLQLYMAGEINSPVLEPLVNNPPNLPSSTNLREGRPVLVPNVLEVTDICLDQLNTHCPFDWESSNHGIDVYLKAINLLQTHN